MGEVEVLELHRLGCPAAGGARDFCTCGLGEPPPTAADVAAAEAREDRSRNPVAIGSPGAVGASTAEQVVVAVTSSGDLYRVEAKITGGSVPISIGGGPADCGASALEQARAPIRPAGPILDGRMDSGGGVGEFAPEVRGIVRPAPFVGLLVEARDGNARSALPCETPARRNRTAGMPSPSAPAANCKTKNSFPGPICPSKPKE
jgi:hypothetical protein